MSRFRSTARIPFIALSALLFGATAFAQSASPIVKVEEDWELEILQPNDGVAAPQLSIQMKPDKGNDDWFAIFCVNFREIPEFAEGGLEIQLWNQEWVVAMDGKAGYQFTIDGEFVQWTQSLKIDDGKLVFLVKDGQSQTFGEFGDETFRVAQPTDLQSLASYSPDATASDSAVTFGANCVNRLRLRRVRYYREDGSIEFDHRPRLVYEDK